MKLFTNSQYPTEVHDVVKLYFADSELTDDIDSADIVHITENNDGVSNNTCRFNGVVTNTSVNYSTCDVLQATRLIKRYAKLCVYNCMVEVTGTRMPWGSLTGIRPTKLAVQLLSEGIDYNKFFVETLGVSQEKTKLVSDILTVQGNLRNYVPNSADLYVGIPFCVTRCSYCSFTSGELNKLNKYVEPYVSALKQDIRLTLDYAKQKGIAIRNVYFGGGTPTSLTATQLASVMDEIDVTPVEYTIEAGRPDTIDEDKLRLFYERGVHRVSINPQTFNQSVLDVVGRKHTVRDIYDKYDLAKKYGFVVNMDLIAGLPTETYEMFCHSVDCAIALSPDNITVHTLALKRGSVLKEQNYTEQSKIVSNMVDYSHNALYGAGYLPYYMYRQKYMQENLENVGFCKNNTPCLYNIDIMEEVSDILACGTNAISKKIAVGENRIERSANAKDVITYIERTKDYFEQKRKLFDEN